RAQQGGSRPDCIFLCGGAAGMPYMREFFHEKFKLPIEFFNPLRNVAVSEAASASGVAHSAHLLGELVGLALRSVTTCPMELSLLPASVVRRQELERRRPFFIAAAACVVLAMLSLRSGSPSSERLLVEHFWAQVKNAPERLHLCLLCHLLERQ